MATRREIDDRKSSLLGELRAYCADRSMSGGTLPPLRNLASKYNVSLAVAHSVLKTLQDEGLVVSVQGAGTSIVTRRFVEDEVFLYLAAEGSSVSFEQDVFVGMTDRFAEMGAFTVAVPNREALSHIARDAILRCRGLYGRLYDIKTHKRLYPLLPFPTVCLRDHADPDVDDGVAWDDHNGGREATSHLLSLGHRRITFVGAMGNADHWSNRRAQGYREGMEDSGYAHNINVIGWEECLDRDLMKHGREAAGRLLAGSLPDAIVACNDEAAVSILEGLLHFGAPLASWPAIVGFDATGSFRNQPISSMRRDGREIGRVSADILWGRSHGTITGGPLLRTLPMLLVPRMTSQKGWAYRLHNLIGVFPEPDEDFSPPSVVAESTDAATRQI